MVSLNTIENIVVPNWSAPRNIQAFTTTRFAPQITAIAESQDVAQRGQDCSPFSAFNLAAHVGDEVKAVIQHRQQLQTLLKLPQQPLWLNQQHTNQVLELTPQTPILSATQSVEFYQSLPPFDASWTQTKKMVCVVMTADCLPILLCDQQGETVCAIHAGWQGIYNGIIPQTLAKLPKAAGAFMAWIGPAIRQKNFEVSEDFFQTFQRLPAGTFAEDADKLRSLFVENPLQAGKYFADLPAMAHWQLKKAGVQEVTLSNLCSYEDNRFYSYRQACHQGDGKTGRMASFIWIE